MVIWYTIQTALPEDFSKFFITKLQNQISSLTRLNTITVELYVILWGNKACRIRNEIDDSTEKTGHGDMFVFR